MKIQAIGHRKFKKLARLLNLPLYAAHGILETLWLVTQQEAPRGDIGKLSDDDIAMAIDWDREPAELIGALIAAGWVDRHPEHRLVIHDWSDHAQESVHTKLAERRLLFCDGRIPKLTKFKMEQRTAIEMEYQRLYFSEPKDDSSGEHATARDSADAAPDRAVERSRAGVQPSLAKPSLAKPSQAHPPAPSGSRTGSVPANGGRGGEGETPPPTDQPDSPAGKSPPALDECWTAFRGAAEGRDVLRGSPADWGHAYRAWRLLDGSQKLAALADVRARDPDSPEMRSLPGNYVRERRWERPPPRERPPEISPQMASRKRAALAFAREKGEIS